MLDPLMPPQERHELVAMAAYEWMRMEAGHYLLQHTQHSGADTHSALIGMMQALGECMHGVSKPAGRAAMALLLADLVRNAAIKGPNA